MNHLGKIQKFMALALALAAISLTGCVSVGTRQIVRLPDQGKTVEDPQLARIYVLRASDRQEWTYLVRDGTKRIGMTAKRGYLCWERPPGDVVISGCKEKFGTTNACVELNLEANTAYYIKQSTTFFDVMKMEGLGAQDGAKMLKKSHGPQPNAELAEPGAIAVDLSKYATVTVVPFGIEPGQEIDPLIGIDFADDIHELLQNSFGPLFKEVRFGQPRNAPDELIVSGMIMRYSPGSRDVRAAIGLGFGAAGFDAEMSLRDGATNRELLPVDKKKLWAWGGVLGGAKGIEDTVTQASIECAATIATAKGWKK